jgi:hypothetical protein
MGEGFVLHRSAFSARVIWMLAVVLFASVPAMAQTKAASQADVKTPRTADGHPDFNGLWNDSPTGNLNPATRQFERSTDGSILFDFSTKFNQGHPCLTDACQFRNQPPYKPEYMAKVKAIAATMYNGTTPLDPEMQCKPWGIPRGAVGGEMQIVQTPQVIAILYEGHPQPSSIWRIIYMDGRGHPEDLDTSYMGDSIGHWEGDTLVVDVTGLNDETWLGGGARAKYSTIHSDQEHVIERWTRKGDVITYQATVEDPVMFTRPWILTPRQIHTAIPGDAMEELFCTPQATSSTHFVKPDAQEGCSYRCN